MWKTVGLAAGAVAAGILIAGSTLPVSGAANNDDDGLRDFRVRVVMGEEHYVDNPPRREESPGDMFLFTNNLRKHGEQVGRAAVQCTLMPSSGPVDPLCAGVVNFPGKGKITLQGMAEDANRFAVPITGGSGEFKDAGGQMFVIDPPGPREHWRFDFAD